MFSLTFFFKATCFAANAGAQQLLMLVTTLMKTYGLEHPPFFFFMLLHK